MAMLAMLIQRNVVVSRFALIRLIFKNMICYTHAHTHTRAQAVSKRQWPYGGEQVANVHRKHRCFQIRVLLVRNLIP